MHKGQCPATRPAAANLAPPVSALSLLVIGQALEPPSPKAQLIGGCGVLMKTRLLPPSPFFSPKATMGLTRAGLSLPRSAWACNTFDLLSKCMLALAVSPQDPCCSLNPTTDPPLPNLCPPHLLRDFEQLLHFSEPQSSLLNGDKNAYLVDLSCVFTHSCSP